MSGDPRLDGWNNKYRVDQLMSCYGDANGIGKVNQGMKVMDYIRWKEVQVNGCSNEYEGM